MDGDSYVDLVVTQLSDDGTKRKVTIIPQIGGKYDSIFKLSRIQG